MTKSPIPNWSLVIGHLSLLIVLAACARPDVAWDRMRETSVLRVGMDASFPPFESIAADGTLVGFDVDLARELGRRLGPALSEVEGVEVQFVANLPYDGLYDALAVGRVDVIISALVVNPARMADFAYSTPYFDAGQVLVVRPPSVPPASGGEERGGGVEERRPEPVEGMADLSGRTLAVEFGTQGDLEARKWARRLLGLTVVSCETAAEALSAVAAGEADGALVDHVSALAATARTNLQANGSPEPGAGSELVIVGQPVVEEPYAVALHRESRRLMRAINEALVEMKADGTMDALVAKWLEKGL